jgi:site-specific recombinase XerD
MTCRYRRVPPHLYTPEEITALVRASAALKHPLRALNYQTLIGLLAVSGMRVGEACHLDRADIDLNAGVLTVRADKPGKAREVPLHPTATQALRAYGQQRDQLCRAVSTPAFFINTRGNRLAAVAVLREREQRISAVQRIAVVDAAARWLAEDAGEELARALLEAVCSESTTAALIGCAAYR